MLIEREQDLEQLDELLSGAELRRGRIVQVTGEAGIGKTSVVQAFVERLSATQRVAFGLCDALYTPRPLGAVYEIAASLGRQCAELAEQRCAADELFPALLRELQSAKNTLVLVAEDVHWADKGTLDFIRYLGRRIAHTPVLFLITYRDDEVTAEHPLTQVLGDIPAQSLARIQLNPLSSDGIELLNLSHSVSSEEILRVTGGNPFFITELLASQDHAMTSAPSSVREAVNARLSRISESERSFLEAASLIPVSIRTELLDPMFNGNAEMLASACIGRGLLKREQDGALRFRHELARLATAERLTNVEQQRIHEQLLEILLRTNEPPLDQLVHHAAGALKTHEVLKYAPIAAEEAAKLGAHREACGHLATALEFVSEAGPELAATLYERWAYEAGLSLKIDDDVIDARRHAITLWRALGRKDKVGENLRWLSRLHWYRGEAAKAAQYSDDAVNLLESEQASPEKAMAYSLRSQLHMLNDRMSLAIDWGEKAIEIAQNYDAKHVVAHALNNIGTAKLFRGEIAGLDDMNESLRLSRALKQHEDVARVYTNLAEYAVEFRDFSLAEQILSEGIAFDTEHDLDSWTFYLIGRLAQLRLDQGRLEDAKTIAEGVLARDDQTLLMKLPANIVLAKTHLRLGIADARTKLSDALQAALSTGEMQYIVPVRTAFLEAAALAPNSFDWSEHLAALLNLRADDVMLWRRAEIWLWSQQCGCEEDHELFKDLPKPYAALQSSNYRLAADEFARLGMAYHAAYANMLQGSEQSVISAHRASLEIGAKPLEAACKDQAKEKGFLARLSRKTRGPYGASKSHPLGLTKKEQEILAQLATGATNQEIAEALSRSRRTVENHVSAVLRKLNANSRTDVILRLQNEPWLLPKL